MIEGWTEGRKGGPPYIGFKQLRQLASPKSVGQANRLETQAGLKTAFLRQNFFSGKSQNLLLRP